jgi:hypothetical protein
MNKRLTVIAPLLAGFALGAAVVEGVRAHPRPPLAPVAPHQQRPARDAAHAMERGGMVRGQVRVQASARATEPDPSRGLVQLGS